MATKTFSSRANAAELAYADAITRRELGISFGQYCGSMLVEYVCETGTLPDLRIEPHQAEDFALLRRLSSGLSADGSLIESTESSIAKLADDQIRDLITGRYA